jgi:hypothetical protein
MTISLNQIDERTYPRGSNYKYSDCRLALMKVGNYYNNEGDTTPNVYIKGTTDY